MCIIDSSIIHSSILVDNDQFNASEKICLWFSNNNSRLNTDYKHIVWKGKQKWLHSEKEDIVWLEVRVIHFVRIHMHFQGLKDCCARFHPAAFILLLRSCVDVKCEVHHICSSMSGCLSQSSSSNDSICCGLTASRHNRDDICPAVCPVHHITYSFLYRSR